MTAGSYQTDSLPRIVILGGVWGLGDAAALPGGGRQPGTHFAK
jgi:hypothetical protein